MPASRTSTCPTCSSMVDDGDRFCKTCGTEVSGISASIVAGQDASWASGSASAPTTASPWDGVLARLRDVTIGEFDVGRELGRGGMAAVFLAHDLTLSRKVAIKVMAPGLMLGEGMVARFRQEAITIANLQHANIVTVHAVRQLSDLHFFVMQFVEGQSLEGVLREHGALPLSIVRPIMHQVGSALAYAHRRGVIHRDVKPGNILLSGDGDALVTDFGIAKVAEGPTQTQTGMVVGTPTYMSPEQCFASELDGASDQYSLGIVAYQMLAGHAPFTGPAFSIMNGHTTAPVPSLRAVAPDVPEDVEAAILRMLAKKPEDRFRSFAEALDAMGAQPLGEHSPVRQEMIRLAAVQERREALGDLLRTPSSPVPRSRSAARVPSAGATPRTPSPAAAVTSSIAIAVAPVPDVIEVGDQLMLRATVRGATDPASMRWGTETPTVVRVAPESGMLEALAEGDALVYAQFGEVTDRLALRVVAPRVATVQVRPLDADVHVGDTLRLVSSVVDKRGETVLRDVEWSAVGTSLRIDPDGTAHALAVGRTAITMACDEHYDTLVVHVLPARVVALDILAPSEPLEVGHAVTLGVVARDANGTRLVDRAVQWSTDRPECARIDAAGVFSALSAGAVRVRASCEGVDAELALIVPPARAASVSILNMPELVRDGDRFVLVASARDSRGAALSSVATWRSGSPPVATVDAQGKVHARTAGTTEISASVDGVVAITQLVVRATHAAFAAASTDAGTTPLPASATAVLAAFEPAALSALEPAVLAALEPAALSALEPAVLRDVPIAPLAPGAPPSAAANTTPAKTPSSVSSSVSSSASSSASSSVPTGVSTGVSTGAATKRPTWLIGAAIVPVALVAWLLTRGGEDKPAAAPVIEQPARANEADADVLNDAPPVATAPPAADTVIETPPAASAANRAVELRLVPPANTTLRVNETLRLRVSTVDERSGQTVNGPVVNFTSSDRSIAIVDRRTGEVRAIRPGRVTMTADAGDAGRETVRLTIADAVTASAEPTRETAVAPATVTPPASVPATPPPNSVSAPAAAESAVVSQAQLAREARAVIDAYARAFATKDISRLRALNPSIPSEEQSFYTDLFRNSETVTVTVKSVNLSGSRRDYDPAIGTNTSLTATFDFVFVSKNRGVGRQASDGSWQVTLQREGSGWKLVRLVTG